MSDDLIVVGEEMPVIGAVRHVRDMTVSVRWAAGSRAGISEEVDLASVVMQFRVFAPLRNDPESFAAVHLVADGTAIGWNDDADMEIAATTVERLAAEAMSNEDFKRFIRRHHFTLDGASGALGISRRQIAYYLKDKPIPRYVALACLGYDTTVTWQHAVNDEFRYGNGSDDLRHRSRPTR